MINFFMPDEDELFESFLVLCKMVRKKDYGETMIGPFEDFALVKLGIFIDGEKEEELAQRFQDYIEDKGYKFDKTEELGAAFFRERSW